MNGIFKVFIENNIESAFFLKFYRVCVRYGKDGSSKWRFFRWWFDVWYTCTLLSLYESILAFEFQITSFANLQLQERYDSVWIVKSTSLNLFTIKSWIWSLKLYGTPKIKNPKKHFVRKYDRFTRIAVRHILKIYRNRCKERMNIRTVSLK